MGESRRVFSEHEMRRLEANDNVQHVSETNITYAPSFKLAAVKAYEQGRSPMEIFVRAGFDVDVIGRDKPRKSLQRWREMYAFIGEEGLTERTLEKLLGLLDGNISIPKPSCIPTRACTIHIRNSDF